VPRFRMIAPGGGEPHGNTTLVKKGRCHKGESGKTSGPEQLEKGPSKGATVTDKKLTGGEVSPRTLNLARTHPKEKKQSNRAG